MMMEGGEDWIMRPVLAGLCRYESLADGTVGLRDLGLMNEALDVQAENDYRMRQERPNGQ
jgi:hypothetical protein